MRIVLLQETDWFLRGPHDQHHLAEKLSLRGHEVRVIDNELFWRTEGKKELCSKRKVFSNISRLYDDAEITLIRPGIIKIPWLDYVSLLFSHRNEIKRQIREFAPDVLIGFGILNSYLAAKAAKKNNVPFIYCWTDIWHTHIPFKFFQPIGKAIEKMTLREADIVFASNRKLKDRLIKMGAPPEQTYISRKGIDFGRFNPERFNRSLLREQYRINRADTVLLFVGILSSFTGLRELVLEFSKVNDACLKLMIVGEGELSSELQQIREKHGLQQRLILTGRRPYDEIPALVIASDICLLPFPITEMTNDLVPMKIFDYISMKKPVISTKLPGMIEEFGENNGIVYVDKPKDMIAKALELVSQGDLAELGVKARRLVEGYSWDSVTDEFERILDGAVRGKRG